MTARPDRTRRGDRSERIERIERGERDERGERVDRDDAADAPSTDLASRVLSHCDAELATLRVRAARRTRLALAGMAALALFTLSLHVAFLPRLAAPGGLGDPGTLAAVVSTEPAAPAMTPQAAHGAQGAQGAQVALAALPAADLAPAATPAGAAHWLANTLRPDGRFDAGRFEVPRSDEVGLHALALLALASADPDPSRTDETAQAALHAARWLLDQQDDDGAIGAPVGAGFDHALGTVALLEAGALTGDDAVRAAARRAVALIAERQARDGGWQPRAPGMPGSTPAQTAWTLAALLRAQQLGETDLGESIARGQARLVADLGPTDERGLAAADLDLDAVKAVALGACRPRATSPVGGLYAASLAVLAAPAFPR